MTKRSPLRVLTWNILKWGRTRRFDAFAEQISDVAADVVLLQEADAHTTTRLAERLGYTPVCPDAGPVERDDPAHSHPCALTTLPVRTVRRIDLEAPRPDRQPAALGFEAEIAEGRWAQFVSVHLSHTHQAGRLGMDRGYLLWDYEGEAWAGERADSVRRRLMQIPAVFADPGEIAVACGDVNCPPHGPEFRAIQAAGWADSWAAAPRLGSGTSIVEASPYTATEADQYRADGSACWPRSSGPWDYTLDAQFHRGLVPLWAWTIGRGGHRDWRAAGYPNTVKTTGDAWVVDDWPSDHLGLVVDYEFPWELRKG